MEKKKCRLKTVDCKIKAFHFFLLNTETIINTLLFIENYLINLYTHIGKITL